MDQAPQIIPRLRQLSELEGTQSRLKKNNPNHPTLATEIEQLRAVLPTSILRHHDSRRSRGKISVAPVVGGVCGACHLAIPRGRLLDLQRVAHALNVCDHCGVFIYLPEAAEPPRAGREKVVRKKRAPRSPKAGGKETVGAR
ncbi:MAG: hypothetical protein PHC88_12455 [Terrimicrobiaceae bacterium]|nr:hypothetical protein [Terrimicrobiaceae bacterium]